MFRLCIEICSLQEFCIGYKNAITQNSSVDLKLPGNWSKFHVMIHIAVVSPYQFGCRYMNLKVVWEFMLAWSCSFCSNINLFNWIYIFYSDKGLGWAAILGIVLGCLAFVVIVLVVVVICCYYANNRDRYGDRYSRGGGRQYGAYSNRGYSNMQNYKVGHCLCMMQSKWNGCT